MNIRTKTGNMMSLKTFRFRNFPVYLAGLEFIHEVKSYTTRQFPKTVQFSLTSQLWRAMDSIVLNIAEGSDKYSDIDFSRYLNNALGSLNEVVACLDLALQEKYVTSDKHKYFLEKADNLYRQLKAFSSRVRKTEKGS